MVLGLMIAMHLHAGIQYIEVFGGGLALIIVAAGLLAFNGAHIPRVVLPADAQAASVAVIRHIYP